MTHFLSFFLSFASLGLRTPARVARSTLPALQPLGRLRPSDRPGGGPEGRGPGRKPAACAEEAPRLAEYERPRGLAPGVPASRAPGRCPGWKADPHNPPEPHPPGCPEPSRGGEKGSLGETVLEQGVGPACLRLGSQLPGTFWAECEQRAVGSDLVLDQTRLCAASDL
ncbi:unnamed protein product [Rangifer tarandus platyrhynchus]|uniref:Uncharacterized protein n=1 Tax=Rangifer tarandus platyrhynchus TaxID=3082113 RepID=A0AC59ZSG0_RANTA